MTKEEWFKVTLLGLWWLLFIASSAVRLSYCLPTKSRHDPRTFISFSPRESRLSCCKL